MQGDLGTTPLGNPVATAGMIPRALLRLFKQLEESGADYSVKISYIELYNEELRDLLASDLAAPVGSSQPMSMGSGSSRDVTAGGLKIFDDSSKRGVLIQGLEEIPVKSATDALALLVKGSDRRQIAATKFNDHSSRSHSVFSITVHTKEVSTMGDDLLRVGKLNLVDLAGSENIGRSGAENKRAREAGMINQSLLTLGRVINALVERSPHIPYRYVLFPTSNIDDILISLRESKLTRLLQDSLGGRTKTCIIATISPARSNMEETLSTLDYAIRAKSIRNRPEINQRMTRNALLKEYVAEIECLKADLLAAREKNGIFFSEDTWNQMNVEQELTRTALEETKRQVEIVARQLKNVQEEYQESMNLLTKRDSELKEAKQELSETNNVLTTTSDELRTTKRALDEEVVVRESYQTTEATLDEVAKRLKHTAQESLADLSAMFAKLCTNVSTKFTLRKLKILYSTEDHSAQCECGNRPQLWKGFNLRDAETLRGIGRFHQKHYARPDEAALRRRSISG
jgi:kinesin family member 11